MARTNVAVDARHEEDDERGRETERTIWKMIGALKMRLLVSLHEGPEPGTRCAECHAKPPEDSEPEWKRGPVQTRPRGEPRTLRPLLMRAMNIETKGAQAIHHRK